MQCITELVPPNCGQAGAKPCAGDREAPLQNARNAIGQRSAQRKNGPGRQIRKTNMNTERISAMIQLKAFARVAGLKMAVLWIASFACFVAQFRMPGFSMPWLLSLLIIPYFLTRLAQSFRNVLDGVISFRRSWLFSAYTICYASILFALAQYLYFAFIDHGFIIDQYVKVLQDPASSAIMASYGYSKSDINMVVGQLLEIRPIHIAFNCATMNILAGLLLSLPVAALTRRMSVNASGINKQKQ